MSKRLVNVLSSLFIVIIIMILYTIIHEGAHALFVIIFGGKVSAFDFNMLSGYPHIRWEGNMNPYENAVISIAGPLIPYLLLIISLAYINKSQHLLIHKIFLFVSLAVLGSIVPNIVIPVLLETGVYVADEDIAKFVTGMNLNGYIVALIMAILFILAVILVIKRLRIKDALAYSIDIDLHNKKIVILVIGLILIFTGILIAVFFNLINQAVNNHNTNIPQKYDKLIELDLKNIDNTESEIYQFIVEKPALYDFIIVGNIDGEINLKLAASSRINGQRTNEMLIPISKGKVNSNYSNWLLNNGNYKLCLTKASSEGKIKIYINSKIPNDTILNLLGQDEAILNGDIPQQEFKLAAKEELSDYSNKSIYEFTIDRDKSVFFSIFLTTRKGKARVVLIGENYEEELISEYQIKTEGRSSFLKNGKYKVIVSCDDCDGHIYLFFQE